MPKRSLKRRHLRGGAWYNPVSWFSSNQQTEVGPKRSWGEWWNSTTGSAESSLQSINPFSESTTTTSYTPAPTATTSSTPSYTANPAIQEQEQMPQQLGPVGGRRRHRRSRGKRYSKKQTQKGGKTGVAYYAAPVSNTNTAKPTYWIKGGKRTRRQKH
jgi:hypothetical protein